MKTPKSLLYGCVALVAAFLFSSCENSTPATAQSQPAKVEQEATFNALPVSQNQALTPEQIEQNRVNDSTKAANTYAALNSNVTTNVTTTQLPGGGPSTQVTTVQQSSTPAAPAEEIKYAIEAFFKKNDPESAFRDLQRQQKIVTLSLDIKTFEILASRTTTALAKHYGFINDEGKKAKVTSSQALSVTSDGHMYLTEKGFVPRLIGDTDGTVANTTGISFDAPVQSQPADTTKPAVTQRKETPPAGGVPAGNKQTPSATEKARIVMNITPTGGPDCKCEVAVVEQKGVAKEDFIINFVEAAPETPPAQTPPAQQQPPAKSKGKGKNTGDDGQDNNVRFASLSQTETPQTSKQAPQQEGYTKQVAQQTSPLAKSPALFVQK